MVIEGLDTTMYHLFVSSMPISLAGTFRFFMIPDFFVSVLILIQIDPTLSYL